MNCLFSSTNLKIFARAVYSLARLPGEDIYIDAQCDGLHIRTLNSSKSAFSAFKFCPLFFLSYVIDEVRRNEVENDNDSTTSTRCKIPSKSAVLIFKTVNNLEKSIETCELKIDLPNCRLVFLLRCKFGIVRTYNFVLIECDSVETLYDRKKCQAQLVIPATVILGALQGNFRNGQEDVTLKVDSDELLVANCVDDEPDPDRCVKTILRLNAAEFDKFIVENAAEVTFCLKELRAFLTFIEVYRLPVSIYFDQSGKPIIFALESDPNFGSELILATYLIQDTTLRKDVEDSIEAVQQNTTVLSQGSIKAGSKGRRLGDSQRVSEVPTNFDAVRQSQLFNKGLPTSSQKVRYSKRNIHNKDTTTRSSDAQSILTDSLMEVDDRAVHNGNASVLHAQKERSIASPPSKKQRSFLLVQGWSQSSFDVDRHSPSPESGDVLAPDSDLEDR